MHIDPPFDECLGERALHVCVDDFLGFQGMREAHFPKDILQLCLGDIADRSLQILNFVDGLGSQASSVSPLACTPSTSHQRLCTLRTSPME